MVPNMRPRIREGHEFDSPVGTRHLGMATHMHAHVERDVWSGLGECVPLARCRQQSKVLGGELGPLRSGRIRERRHPFGVGCKSVRHHLHKGPRKIVCVEANATKQRSARRTKTKTQEASGARGSASEGASHRSAHSANRSMASRRVASSPSSGAASAVTKTVSPDSAAAPVDLAPRH